MKLFSTLALLLTLISSTYAQAAAPISAAAIRLNYATAGVSQYGYTQILSSTLRNVAGVSVVNGSNGPIGLARGAVGQEAVQLAFPGTTVGNLPVFYPVNIGPASRLSIIALGNHVSTGELILNVVYK